MGLRRLWKTLVIGCLMFAAMSMPANASGGAFNYNEDGTVTRVQAGIMPSTGEVETLVFMVEFPDVKHSEGITVEYAEDIFFGENPFWCKGPGTSQTLAGYLELSSYEKLQFDGEVYGWYTAEHERAYYSAGNLEYPHAENLFWEVVEAYDDEIDFSKYDSDQDGYVDGVYIVFAGATDGWGSTYWSYVDRTMCTDEKDGMKLAQYAFIAEEHLNAETLAHESGHMLGLIDYYDYEKQTFGAQDYFGGTSTKMLDNTGDYDAWAKILLGWIDPIVVESDCVLTIRPKNDYADALIVRPKEEKYKNMFFVVEYENIFGEEGRERVRIYRINCEQADGGGFKYVVTDSSELKPIEMIYDSESSDAGGVSPYQTPASFMIWDNGDGTETKEFTGVKISHGELDADGVTCTITYEEFNPNHKPGYTMETKFANNKVYIDLVFDVEMYLKEAGQTATVTGGGQTFTMSLERNRRYEYHLYSEEQVLLPDTTYTVSIPANCLVSYYGGENDAITYTFVTDVYPAVGEYAQRNISESVDWNNMVKLSGDEYGVFDVLNGKLRVNRYDCDGYVETCELAEANTKQYQSITACVLDNREIVIAVTAYDSWADIKTDFYRWYPDGTCEKVLSNVDVSPADLYAMGRNVVWSISGCDVFMLRHDNEFVEMREKYIGIADVADAGGGQYWVCTANSARIYLVDEDFNVIKQSVGGEQATGKIVTFYRIGEYKGYLAAFGVMTDRDGNSTNAILCYDRDCNLVEVKEIGYDLGQIIPYKYGYVIVHSYDIPINNAGGEGIFSGWINCPVAYVTVCDSYFNKKFSYTLDYDGLDYGDMFYKFVELDNGAMALSTKWSTYYMADCDWENVGPTPRIIGVKDNYTFYFEGTGNAEGQYRAELLANGMVCAVATYSVKDGHEYLWRTQQCILDGAVFQYRVRYQNITDSSNPIYGEWVLGEKFAYTAPDRKMMPLTSEWSKTNPAEMILRFKEDAYGYNVCIYKYDEESGRDVKAGEFSVMAQNIKVDDGEEDVKTLDMSRFLKVDGLYRVKARAISPDLDSIANGDFGEFSEYYEYHKHVGITHHEAVPATCTTDGTVEYWTCSSEKCAGKYYGDAECKSELKRVFVQGAHKCVDWLTDSEMHWKVCVVCKEDVKKGAHVYDNDSDGVCNICNYMRGYEVVVEEEELVYKPDQSDELTFKVEADIALFKELVIDGRVVPREYYTLTEGSTIVTLKTAYLDTLDEGEHCVEVQYTDGKSATVEFELAEKTEDRYIGNVNSELLKFTYDEATNYLSGEIVVVEWVNGESTVPSVKPIMTFDAVDGSESIEVFVTATGTNTYYFDRLLAEGLTPGKEYIFNVTSGNDLNVSVYKTVPIYTGTSAIGAEGMLGVVGEQAVCYKTDAATGYLLVYGNNDIYFGNVNSVLAGVQCVTAGNGDNFVSGNIVIVEWINGVSHVPSTTPKMTFESYDGTERLDVFMACLDGTNTYYFDRNLTEDMDVTKEYIFRISLTDERNMSKYKSMVATTNYMDEKEGMLWETATQKVMYKTVAADGDNQLRIYAVNK